MKKQIFTIKQISLLLSFLLASQFVFSQGPWEKVYDEDDQFIRDMCFVAGDDGLWQTGWAINYGGDVLKTTDGGDTWTSYSQSHSVQLGGISFADETTGYIATLDDQILKSTDGGETWVVNYAGVSFDKVALKDDENGCVVGGAEQYTVDGGVNWYGSTGGSNYWDLDYAAGDDYYAVHLGGNLGHSDDGGQTWSNVESLGQLAAMVDFHDSNHGMFGGDLSKVKVTTDGGDNWTTSTLGAGQGLLVCGAWFDHDTLYASGSPADLYKSTDGGLTWSTDTSFAGYSFRAMVVSPRNNLYLCGEKVSTGEGVIFKKEGLRLQAIFEASEDTICVGSTVDFADLSVGIITDWDWTFEGGTPSSSTEQNPSVTYNSTGSFDVELTVTDNYGDDTKIKVGYINVLDVPGQADEPIGEETVCTGLNIEYNTNEVEFAQEYEWEVDPADAGILIWDDNVATLETDETWTGDFTIRVRATNICGDGEWSDDYEGTLYLSPEAFDLEGGGSYCLDGDGVEITLSDTETGIDYELYMDGEPTGNIVAGTGSEISFGLLLEEAYYTAIGYSDYCSTTMNDGVSVVIDFPPIEPATPTGPLAVCNDEVSEYESDGVEDAESYTWTLSPEEAGVLTADELNASVEWSTEFTGTAYISLFGINECGDGNTSAEIEILVDAIPEPEIDGEELVCDNHIEEYVVEENAGNTYDWEVIGGTITDGQDTYLVTIQWGEPGDGLLTLVETSPNGCVGDTAEIEVVVDDCTGLIESEKMNDLKVYPNPASNLITIEFDSEPKANATITVFSQLGQTLIERDVNDEETKKVYQINISHLQKGIYIIRIADGEGVITTKQFIKK